MVQNITEDRIIYLYKKKDINDCDDKEQAASVFHQMSFVLDVMKADLKHRKKSLKRCAKS